MAQYLKMYAGMLVVFLAIDLAWIGVVARNFYRKHIGFLLAETPVWSAALLFYALFVLGILVFVVLPGLEAGITRSTLLRAAFFGLVCYATFDLTCQALVKDWPIIVTVVDMVWGMVISAAVSTAGLFIGTMIRTS